MIKIHRFNDHHRITIVESQETEIQSKLTNQKKILVIDDDTKIINSLKRWLNLNGYECHATSKPTDTLDRVYAIKPDLILLDLNMPEISGLGVLDLLKSNAQTKSIPVIVLSGTKKKEIVMEAMNRGAAGFLDKSYILQDLIKLVDQYCQEEC